MYYDFDIKIGWSDPNNVVDLSEYRQQKEKEEVAKLIDLVNDILYECPPESKAFYVSLEKMLSDELIK
jgi:protein associated with RNAse G/E